MAPALVRPPFHRDSWVYEEKVDGWRMLAYKDGSRVRLISRNAGAIAKLRPDTLVLDGEVAVFDEQLVSRFHLLGEPDPTVLCTPSMFIAFDVLEAGRQDVRPLALARRRRILEDAIDGSEMVLPVRRLEADGANAWQTVERRGLEGFVAKDPASTYRAGPTRSWVKVKQRHEGVFVVGGIRNVDAFDGVLVGELVGDALHLPRRRRVGVTGRRTCSRSCSTHATTRSGHHRLPMRRGCGARCGWSPASGRRSATRRLSRDGCGRRRGADWHRPDDEVAELSAWHARTTHERASAAAAIASAALSRPALRNDPQYPAAWHRFCRL